MSSEDPHKFVDRLLDAGRGEAPNAAGKSSALAAVERGDAPRAAPPKGTPWTTWAARAVGTAVVVGVAVWALSPRTSELAPPVAPTVTDPVVPPFVPPGPVAPPEPITPPVAEPVAEDPLTPPVAQLVTDAGASEIVAVAPPKPKRQRVDAGGGDDDTLARELELLESARTLLPTKPAKALATLESYFKRYPQGSLTQEASLLKIEALVRVGRRADAELAAKRFLGAGSSPLLQERVRTILEAGKQ